MTKQIKRTTNKLVLTYNNNTTYTIPRVTNFTVSEDGKTVSGSYNKTVKFHGITQEHSISFNINLKDVVEMEYIGKIGEVSKNFTVSGGRILIVTELRTEEDYYKKNYSIVVDGIITIAGHNHPINNLKIASR